jgi:NitT/TauT family transport system substrate-binding protein
MKKEPAPQGAYTGRKTMMRRLACLVAATAALAAAPAHAEQLAIAQYGITAGGWPYTIALERGFFREEGLNITGIISSQGGGTSLRNMLAGDVVYGEANPGAIVVANQQAPASRSSATTRSRSPTWSGWRGRARRSAPSPICAAAASATPTRARPRRRSPS